MNIRYIGIITSSSHGQYELNMRHAQDIYDSLKKDYEVAFYDIGLPENIDRLIRDKKENKLDIIFNNAAGKNGGDGTVEGLLSLYNIPFVGSDTLATAVAFDKKSTKTLVAAAGVPIIPGTTLTRSEYKKQPQAAIERVMSEVSFPLVVKASQGSDQIGASLVKTIEMLPEALKKGLKEDSELIIEKFIPRFVELTVMVFGNGFESEAFTPGEVVYDSEFPSTNDTFAIRIPELAPEIMEKVRDYARLAHLVIDCSDYSRSDFIVNADNEIFFLETNAHAGLGNGGFMHDLARLTKGWDYDQLIRELLNQTIIRCDSN